MMHRRGFLAGGCAFCASAALAGDGDIKLGCTLPPDEFSRRVQPSPTYALASATDFGSGNGDFDRALAVTLLNLSNTFSVLPGFAFSEKVVMNAFASANTAMGRADGSVVFGRSLFREIMTRRENPELGVAAICAHEFGHIVQYKHGLQQSLIVNGRVKRLELHADFLAGYFAGKRKLEMPGFPAAIFAATQYSFGDNQYGDPAHHGTSKERGDAVVYGFQSAYQSKQPFETALQTGIQYVQQIPV
jgi:hypothetical protein